MSDERENIFVNNHLVTILEGKPTFELINRELTIDKIKCEIFRLSRNHLKQTEVGKLSGNKIEQQKSLVLAVVDEAIKKIHNNKSMPDDDVSTCASEAETTWKVFQIYLDELRQQIQSNVCETGPEEITQRDIIKTINESCKDLLSKIQDLNCHIQRKTTNLNKGIIEKEQSADKLLDRLHEIETKFAHEMEMIVSDGNKNIFKMTELKIESIKSLEKMLNLIEDGNEQNLKEIQKLKEQKLKSEQALQTLVLKFDNDVGSSSDEFHATQEAISAASKNFQVWNKQIVELQLITHTRMIQEKEDEERHEIEIRLEEIRQNHAAKIIQKFVRKIFKEKRKNKKEKKGKKKK